MEYKINDKIKVTFKEDSIIVLAESTVWEKDRGVEEMFSEGDEIELKIRKILKPEENGKLTIIGKIEGDGSFAYIFPDHKDIEITQI